MSSEVRRVAVALIARADRILVQQRAAGSHLAGAWEFPGGKLEPDESWEEALVREVREETGATVAPAGIFDEKTFEYPDRRVQLRFYWAVLEPGSAEPRGRWVGSRELLSLEVPEANKELLPKIAALLEGHEEEEPRAARRLGTLAWALFLLPVAFVIAALVFLTLDNLFAADHRDLGRTVERSFPLHVVSGNRAVFLGVLLVTEALLLAWVRLATARGGRT